MNRKPVELLKKIGFDQQKNLKNLKNFYSNIGNLVCGNQRLNPHLRKRRPAHMTRIRKL